MVKLYSPGRSNKRKPQGKHAKGQQDKTLITDFNHELEGICRVNDKVTFVPGALPGEEVIIRIGESLAQYNRASLEKVIKPSEQRIDPFCEHFKNCGGCQLQQLSIDDQRAYKLAAIQHTFKDIQPDNWLTTLTGEQINYRRKARIACFYDRKQQQLNIGFREKRSKKLVLIKQCDALENNFKTIFEPLSKMLNKLSVKAHIGHITLLQAQTSTLVIRHLKAFSTEDIQLIKAFSENHPMVCLSEPQSNQFHPITTDSTALSYSLPDGQQIQFSANDFIQVNQSVNNKMIEQAIKWLNPQGDEDVLDLFCGLGNFSLPLARLCKSVTGVEGVAEMVLKAKSNAKLNQLENCTFYTADLESDLKREKWFKKHYDIVVLDPARAGAKSISQQLKTLQAKKILYVSCNPATFGRDARAIQAQGYHFVKANFMDMFPHTAHMEMMGLFEAQS